VISGAPAELDESNRQLKPLLSSGYSERCGFAGLDDYFRLSPFLDEDDVLTSIENDILGNNVNL
jgi:hypothetical protein